MNDNITLGGALGVSILGICMVFLVLIILMVIIHVMAAVIRKMQDRSAPAPAAAAPAAAPAPAAEAARGSCGDVKLFDVPDRTAAMVMAIVADEMGVPLNELQFISIKEVEDESK